MLDELVERLQREYGDPGWWPADTPFEVGVGAVLTQNTAWRNVEKAMAALAEAEALTPARIQEAEPELLQTWIRPAGYFRQKADKLARLAGWWRTELGDSPWAQPPDARATDDLRASLLAVRGIGPETADSILLYAFGRPVFVVDAYTARLAVRLGLLDNAPTGYDELQARFVDGLPHDTALYNRLHAQIVYHCKDVCQKRRPKCDACVLAEICQGPVDLES